MNFHHQAPLLGMLVLCSFACFFCVPARQARDEPLITRSFQLKNLDSSEPETLFRQEPAKKTMKNAPSSTRKKDEDDSICTNETGLSCDSMAGPAWIQSSSTGIITNGDIVPATSQARLLYTTISPPSGNTSTVFTFRVLFSDKTNRSPNSLELVASNENNDNLLADEMYAEFSTPKDYVSGCYYTVSTRFDAGTIDYYIQCYDAYGYKITTSTSSVTVTSVETTTTSPDLETGVCVAIGLLFFALSLCIVIFFMKKNKIALASHASSTSTNHLPRSSRSNSMRNASGNAVIPRAINNSNSLVGQRINGVLIRASPTNPDHARSHGSRHFIINPGIPQSAFVPTPSRARSGIPGEPDGEITPRLEPTIVASLETWNEKDLAELARSREFITPEMGNDEINSLGSWDEEFSTTPEQSRQYITPHVNPDILASIETWDEQELEQLARSCKDSTPEMDANDVDSQEQSDGENEPTTAVLDSAPVASDDAHDTCTVILGDDTYIARKIRLTYIDPVIANKIMPNIEHLETASKETISSIKVPNGDDGHACMLLLCHKKGELGNLIPLRRLLAIEALF